ncbi:Sugar phosphate isomerase/epimerase [Halovenus aranensis]|uniref:Sugar phosphate isomerase/epimerase n=1 Tax=Halovenus aranensis TaxID=890420 RepID=A0A1G8U4V5_9EURY|nr:sugar phosphate isomerase/epimerase [Halovenus aranensis]SDJ48135.1 Sugar phosphate isomerase/epimerase [Halovenus aranensis]
MELGVTVGGAVDRIEATGDSFDFVEFGLAESTGVPEETEADLRKACESHDVGLAIHLPFKQVVATAVPELNEGILDYQRRLLSWAGEMGATKAVLHATVRNPSDTDLRPTFADQLSAIVEVGREAGVEVVVENVGHQRRGLPLSVVGNIAHEVDAPICFDLGHAYMEGGNDAVDRFLGNHADRVSHLHVHDARGRGDTHMPLGAGEIDYHLLGDYLGGFDGTVAIEVFTDDVPLLEDTAWRVQTTL